MYDGPTPDIDLSTPAASLNTIRSPPHYVIKNRHVIDIQSKYNSCNKITKIETLKLKFEQPFPEWICKCTYKKKPFSRNKKTQHQAKRFQTLIAL